MSDDHKLVAVGLDQHYIRVWNADGKPLPSLLPNDTPQASRRLIGHSGPVYNLSFSPSIKTSENTDSSKSPNTESQLLLSCSADKTVRLWHLGTWQCLVVYKGHLGPVWDVTWGPFGHYFLTGSHDKTARLWSTENISALRIFVGHEHGTDVVKFHPNNAYCFTGGSDRLVRMWLLSTGAQVRLFTGHTGNITALACSPSGRILASADDAGSIILWDILPGRLLKRMRGHGKGGIWSLSWSVESNVLISGGADGTVRLWDATKAADAPGQGKLIGDGGAGAKIDVGGVQGVGKKKGKETVVSNDQISAFPTKKSPVYLVKFTRMNLALAAGAFLP
jgi:transcription initiation factor TFIID subunit 5